VSNSPEPGSSKQETQQRNREAELEYFKGKLYELGRKLLSQNAAYYLEGETLDLELAAQAQKHNYKPPKWLQEKALDDAIVEAAKRARDDFNTGKDMRGQPLNGAAPMSGESAQYFEREGTICRRRFTKQGVAVSQPLTNFTARIERELEYDDGVGIQRDFEVRVRAGNRDSVCSVAAADFASLNWVTEQVGASAILCAGSGTKDHARAAIQTLSADFKRESRYAHTGWRKVGGAWLYIHGGGAISKRGAVAEIKTKLPAALGTFVLPEPPADPRDAVRASLGLLELAPERLTAPALSAVYRAVLGETDFSLHLAGASGVFKSEVAALLQRHFGQGFDREHLPMTWQSTANANEGVGFAAKDALMVIDDFVPLGSAIERQRQYRDADRLLRAQGNRQGRNRMNADLSLREGRAPRCLFVSTGEEVPRGHSLAARLLILDVAKGDIEPVKLTACQHDAHVGLYAQAMAAHLAWLAGRLDRVHELVAEFKPDLREAERQGGEHPRTPGIAADLFLGFAFFLCFAVDSKAITAAEADRLEARVWHGLRAAAGAQTAHQQSEDPARRFIDLLSAALASGAAHAATAENTRPDNPDTWGWRANDNGVYEPKGPRIAWLPEEGVYLEPEAAYKAAAAMAADGVGLPVAPTTLWKRLSERGWLATVDERRETLKVRKQIGRERRAVIHLRHVQIVLGSPEIPDQPDQPDHKGAGGAMVGFWRRLWSGFARPEPENPTTEKGR